MRVIRFVTAAFLAAVAASAQGENVIATPGEAQSACALLSKRTIEELSGVPLAEGVPRSNSNSVTSCTFAGERGRRVVIVVRRRPAGDWVAGQVARMSRGVRLGTYRETSEIGGRSFLYSILGKIAVLCSFGNGYYLQISLSGMGDDSAITRVLAKLATSTHARMRFPAPTESVAN